MTVFIALFTRGEQRQGRGGEGEGGREGRERGRVSNKSISIREFGDKTLNILLKFNLIVAFCVSDLYLH